MEYFSAKKYVVLLLLLILATVKVYGQDSLFQKKLIIKKKKYKVRELLEHVLPDQGVYVTYHDNIVPLEKEISFHKKQESTVEGVLVRICDNEDLSFGFVNGQLSIKYYDRPENEYKYSISGLVEDASSGESLIGATVYIKELESGIATNGYGFYALTLPQGKYKINVSFIGYEAIVYAFELNKDFQFNFKLSKSVTKLDDVLVEERADFDIKAQNILLSSNKLDMDMAGHIPHIAEVDVFQSSLLLPGISNVGEGVSGVNVRGSAADRNLIMLDEAIIYNTNHFFGLVSVFNPDAVKDVEILKGDLPAKYGGRNSSVMHVRQKEGNENDFHLSGGVGLITSRLMVEGPILKSNANYLLSARSTFWNVILQNSGNPELAKSQVSFQDFNAKFKFNLNSKNKIYVSGYYGSDANKFGIDALQKWGNTMASVRWNKIIKGKHFMNLTSYFSQYRYRVIEEVAPSDFVGTSKISDYAIKFDVATYASPKSLWEYGAELILHNLKPGERIPGDGSFENPVKLSEEYGLETSIYTSVEKHIGKFAASVGLRLSMFYNTGNSDQLVYQEGQVLSNNTVQDTLLSSSGEAATTYFNLMPRVSLKYQWNEKTSIKMGRFVTVQYMHLLSNTLSPASSDFWKISDAYIEPTLMTQTTIGVYRYMEKLDLDFSVELFYRDIENVIDYKDGADLLFNESIETELLFGVERAYGLELFMKKKFGKLTGWFGYTLSKSERKIDGEHPEEQINGGFYFPTNYDRTHDFAITGIYQFTPLFSMSSTFVYYTGRPYSFPDSKYEVDGILVPHFPDRNRDRLSNYHRWDVAATIKLREIRKNGKERRSKSSWVFSIYNVYNRKNAQAYFFRESDGNTGKPVVEKLSVLGAMIPSVTYNFQF